MPRDLTADIPLPPGGSDQSLLHYRILLRYLADHAHLAQLNDGSFLAEPTKIRTLLREMLAELPSTKVPLSLERSTRPPVTRQEQPRWEKAKGDWCPDCGHVHVDESECQFPIGGGRTCRCERQVTA